MNMMPRWDGGYGFQLLSETIHRSDLKRGDTTLASGFTEDISQLHLQGVYTWDRSVRLTAKLPYVVAACSKSYRRVAEKPCSATMVSATSPSPCH